MIEVRIEENFVAMGFDVWIYERLGDELRVWNGLTDPYDYTVISDHAAKPAPSLTIRPDVLAALTAAASDGDPPNVAQGRHLDDAITVRDRLLKLIEDGARV